MFYLYFEIIFYCLTNELTQNTIHQRNHGAGNLDYGFAYLMYINFYKKVQTVVCTVFPIEICLSKCFSE